MFLTDAELARLPPLFREIVTNDRALQALARQPVIGFLRGMELLDRKRSLRRDAQRAYAPGENNRGGLA